MPADDLGAFLDPEISGHMALGPLDLHPRLPDLRLAVRRRHLRDVDAALPAAAALLRVTRQGSDEWVDLLDDECALAGAGFDQSQGRQPFDRVADSVSR